MKWFREICLREDGYLLDGLTALPIGMWFLVGAVVHGLTPDSSRAWTSPALLLIPLVLLGEILVRRFYGARSGVPPTVFDGKPGPLLFVAGLAAIFFMTTTLPVEQNVTMGATNAWVGLALVLFGQRFLTHVLVGWVLVLTGAILLLPLALDPITFTLSLVGGSCVLGGLHEHIVYRRQGTQSRLVP